MTDFSRDEDYEVGVVTFLDVLGFRNLLQTKPAAEIARLLELLRQFSKPSDTINATKVKEIRLYSEARSEIVSDAIVRIRTTHTQQRSGPFILELIDLLHIQVDCITNGILVRGATTIGDIHIGSDLKGPVFGPAFVQAYEMEGQEVVYPRIAVHEEAVRRHKRDKDLWVEGHSYQDELKHIKHLLTRDDAGMYYIDYLRASLEEMDDGMSSWIKFLNRHKELVVSGLKSEVSAKVHRKYVWLANYHNKVVKENLDSLRPEAFSEDHERLWADIFEELTITDAI